jgi:Tfp pilus assembly protein PilX
MKPHTRFDQKNGFALVVTVSMMVLLTIVVVATLSLSTVTLRSVDRDAAQAMARANARLAMMMAIGQLQKEAGPDQRVTATAQIQNVTANPQWTGVWKTDPGNLSSQPVWMVSGDPTTTDPGEALTDANSAVLASPPSTDETREELRAKFVKVSGRMPGRFAYWIGDEGTKAKVNIVRPESEELTEKERFSRAQSPEQPGLALMDSENKTAWAKFSAKSDSAGFIDRETLASLSTVSFALDDSGKLPREEVHNYYFNDLTTGGFGLPVNVKDGGMKADLSVVFDKGSQSKGFVNNFLGATPAPQTIFLTSDYRFGVTDKNKFGLSDKVTNGSGATGFVGPNWGTLYSYGHLWEKVVANQAPIVGLHPLLDTDLRRDDWKPYSESGKGTPNAQDIQHMNSSLAPVVSMLQIGYYLGAEMAPPGPAPANERRFWAKLMIKPIIALWNPYNVHITPTEYMLEWAMAPYMRFDYQKPNSNGTFDNGSRNVTEIWMRDYWKVNSNGMLPTDSGTGKQGGSYLRVRTNSKVDFQPGEIRLFSVAANPIMDDKWKNLLVPNLDTAGAYKTQIVRSENGKAVGSPAATPADQMAGKDLYIPGGYYGWFGDFFLQDTHWDENTATYTGPSGKGTFMKFKNLSRSASATWFTLKAVDNTSPDSAPGLSTHLARYSNLWNGGQDGKAKGKGFIPEPIYTMRDKVRSNAEDSASTRKAYLVDTMAQGQLGHIGTWRFYTRNSTQLEDVTQGLRGWIDSNPRVPAGNLKFDGSNNNPTKGGLQGWNIVSNLIGGASTKDFGDKGGGNRGLVAEGTWETSQRIPEGELNAGRWQGFGGPTASAEGGQTHVIVYDVPRSPLTSVGQFQHAQLSRYNFEPGFVVGNSYANPRIPPSSIVNNGFAGAFNLVDISYEVNNRVWDSTFFSTLSPDYVGKTGSFDEAFAPVISGIKELPNPRMVFNPLTGDSAGQSKVSIDKIILDAQLNAPQAIASRILINGAFNVNSTSKTAWKALLSTMGSNEVPWVNKETKETKWADPKGIRFNRFSQTIIDYGTDAKDADAAFWQGWRTLDEADLDKLAEAMVKQVKERGPFRSMADFVNRNPNSSKKEHQLKGALQAALDETANNTIPAAIGNIAGTPKGTNFPTTSGINGENQAAGHAAYLLQGDVLQSLSPVMQVRSDYFQIRTCGEALDKNGKVLAKAWCEAFVQRMPEYVDHGDKPDTSFANLTSEVNKEFGRRFQIVSFRWLATSEI